MMNEPQFITIEGIEGVGKSTQCALLAKALNQNYAVEIELTREPGGTKLGEAIRSIVLDPDLPSMTGHAELLLMFAARAEHLSKVIRPALSKGRWVICDRFTDATYAYQGGGRELDNAAIVLLEKLVQSGLTPELTILLDIDVEVALRRLMMRGTTDRFEGEQRGFFERVRASYLNLAENHPNRIVVIDGSPKEGVVHESILSVVRERLF
ncbi:MAG TPA: dTMP kinase [Gammaproteobacteria bacterium]|nr:dTMP kinase [Gammaproteobacteria bacterium]|tara:strand:- start:631 stop:1260 length:630 start_codon:yes stop_codon:yes gene_type:complete